MDHEELKKRPFFDVELKIARARLHAQTLEQSIIDWTHESALSARAEYIDNQHGYALILEPYKLPPLLEHWGLLVGDCIHNLRSSLDNLCFALAKIHQDPPAKPKRIQFPIFDDQQRFASDSLARDTMRQIPAAAADLIERWQPFNRGDQALVERDALLRLSKLSNADKHQIPQVVLMAINQRDHRVKLQFENERDATAYIEGPPRTVIFDRAMVPGSRIIEISGGRPIRSMEGQVTIEAVPAIVTSSGPEGVIPTTAALIDHTYQIFDSLRNIFTTNGRP